MILTAQTLENMPPGMIFASGIFNIPRDAQSTMICNDPGNIGAEITWVAKRGNFPDWAIYLMWSSSGWDNDRIAEMGDKLHNMRDVAQLVPATVEAMNKYRQ